MNEDIQKLLDKWQKTYEDLKQQTTIYQNPQTKDISRAVHCQGRAIAIGECIAELYGLLEREASRSLPSSDLKRQLAELYQRSVQIVFQIPAFIDEGGDVKFEYPELGTFYFNIDESMPQLMDLDYILYRNETHSHEAITRICNYVNLIPWPAVFTVDENESIVSVSVRLFLASEGRVPDEGLVKATMGQAMSVIKLAIDKFMSEKQNLDQP